MPCAYASANGVHVSVGFHLDIHICIFINYVSYMQETTQCWNIDHCENPSLVIHLVKITNLAFAVILSSKFDQQHNKEQQNNRGCLFCQITWRRVCQSLIIFIRVSSHSFFCVCSYVVYWQTFSSMYFFHCFHLCI